MTTTPGLDSSFKARLGRSFTIYTAGFVAFIVLMAILSAIGVPNGVIGYLFVGFTLFTYVAIGFMTRTMQAEEYFVAGRRVPALYNGMAAGAGSISATAFLGMAGSLYLLGYDGLAFVLGWTGGYVLVAILIAPYLRKTGAYTVPDFLATRYGGNLTRLIGVIVLLSCSITLAVAQIYATGIISARFLGIDFEVAIYVGVASIVACSIFGGMRSATWTQVAQYIVLIIAFLVPAIWMSMARTGVPVPQLAYGQALQGIGTLEAAQPGTPGYTMPLGYVGYDAMNYFLLVFCLMVGTASLPHLLMRYFTTPSAREARSSVAWSLFFVFVLVGTAPAYAAFAKWTMLDLVASGLTPDTITEKAGWLMRWAAVDNSLVEICGKAAVDAMAVATACAEQGVTRIGLGDIRLAPDMIVLATPEMAGMPNVVTGLVAAGALAATLSSAGALLLAIANALGHDVYHKMLDRKAPTARRLAVSRIMLLLVAVLAAYAATTRPSDLLTMASWAFSLAAAGLFPALVLGIWWRRANSAGAASGMIVGFGVCLYYLLGTRYDAVGFYELWSGLSSASPEAIAKFAELKTAWSAATGDAQVAAWAALDSHARTIANWWGVNNLSAAAFGMPVGLLVMVVVSRLERKPSRQMPTSAENSGLRGDGTIVDEKAG